MAISEARTGQRLGAAVPGITAQWIAERLEGRRSEDIWHSLSELVRAGRLEHGTRLPTIRDVAQAAEVSVSVVTDAWRALREEGLISTHRRGGTLVVRPSAPEAGRAGFSGWASLDLVHGHPDPELVPPLDAAVLAVLHAAEPRSSWPITRRLRAAAQASWPFPVQDFIAVPTGRAALHAALAALLPGGVLAIEDPGMARNQPVLDALGVRAIPVRVDAEGPVPESLASALAAGARAFSYQPAAQIPTGAALTARRRDELVRLLAAGDPEVWILEEDPAGPLARAESLGTILPGRVLRIRQYWRAYGSDVQVAVLGGATRLVEGIRNLSLTQSMQCSGILQDLLALLIEDPGADETVARAAQRYAERNALLSSALERRGAAVRSYGGLFVWIEVDDETTSIARLAHLGINAMGGSWSSLDPSGGARIRLATTRLPDDPGLIDEFAAAIAGSLRGAGFAGDA